ncbi:MAG: hypothetical protein ACI4RB_04135, partial [Acutalibacteraceae bacterium]
MKFLLKNARVYIKGKFESVSVLVDRGIIADIISNDAEISGVTVFDFKNSLVFEKGLLPKN